MTETRLQAVKRRWRNITNAIRGIDVYVDEHGTRHVDIPVTADEAALAAWALRTVEGAPRGLDWDAAIAHVRARDALAARFEAVQ